jgi:hypothetical protein
MTEADTTESSLLRYLKESVGWLKAALPPESHKWNVPECSLSQISLSDRPDFVSILLYKNQSMPPFVSYVRDLESDNALAALRAAVTTNGGAPAFIFQPDYIAKNMLMTYLIGVTSLEFDESVACEIAKVFSESVRSMRGGVRKVVVLDGFSCGPEFSNVECGNGFVIRRFHPNEFAKLMDLQQTPSIDTLLPIREFMIEKIEEKRLDEPHNGPIRASDPYVNAILTALRVLAPGKLASLKHYHLPVRPGFLQTMIGTSGFDTTFRGHPHEYKFPMAKNDKVAPLAALASGANTPKQFKIALARLDSSAERLRLEDSFIDHVIALEAIFGDDSDGFPGGLTYKLAMRAARYLYDDVPSRMGAVRDMKASLKLRGKVVHGVADLSKLSQGERENIAKIGDMLRASLEKILIEVVAKSAVWDGTVLDQMLLSTRS